MRNNTVSNFKPFKTNLRLKIIDFRYYKVIGNQVIGYL